MSKKDNKEAKVEEVKEEPVVDSSSEAVETPVEENSKESKDSAEDKIAELEKKIEELSASNAELKDQMIRRQAETENYRKRLARDKEEAVQFANSRLISDILPFLDNLDRALAAAKNGGDTEKLVEGIEMAQSQFLTNLDKDWGLKVIDAVGKEFDPQMHEACMVTVDDSLEHETVLEDFIKGYTLHDRVLRPSKVRIGKPN
jgi:molecular chaperone GrpE